MVDRLWDATPIVGVDYLDFGSAITEDEIQRRSCYMLARALNIGRVIGFIGAGISVAYGKVTWTEFAKNVVDRTLAMLGDSSDHLGDTLDILEEFRNSDPSSLSSPPSSSQIGVTERTLLILGICQDLLERQQKYDDLRKEIKTLIARENYVKDPLAPDPLKQVIEILGIQRFITTNYDKEIEDAFLRIARPKSVRSFEFSPDRLDELVQFAVGAPGYDFGVFHMHGNEDEQQHCVVTERDYQRTYLLNDPGRRTYRDALNALFAGNAVLFMGAGMQEGDLLRPLREFVSARAVQSREPPLFALIEGDIRDIENRKFRRYLYDRYGVKAIYYARKEGETPTNAFCAELTNISHMRNTWWINWRKKPASRKPKFGVFSGTNTKYRTIHHCVALETREKFSKRNIDEIRRIINSPSTKLILVAGSAGTGKGSAGIELTDTVSIDMSFFATMHFTNEFLSTIEAAVNFVDSTCAGGCTTEADDANTGSAVERFDAALHQRTRGTGHRPALVVIGGIERLLTPAAMLDGGPNVAHRTDPSTQPMGYVALGQPINSEARRFFDAIKRFVGDPSSGSARLSIVLTGSVMPVELFAEAMSKSEAGVTAVVVRGVPYEEIKKHGAMADFIGTHMLEARNQVVGRLHDALRGHAYALSVVERVLKNFGGDEEEDQSEWLQRLITSLTVADLSRRPQIVIEKALNKFLSRYVQPGNPGGSVVEPLDVLKAVALFTTPVEEETVTASFPGSDRVSVRQILDDLVDWHLLLRVEDASGVHSRYTAHTVVRLNVLHELGELPSTPGEPQHLDLTSYSDDKVVSLPSTPAEQKFIENRIEYLLRAAERHVAEMTANDGPGKVAAGTRMEALRLARGFIRGVFGMIRSCWTATGVGRHYVTEREVGHSYDTYVRHLATILNLTRMARPMETWVNRRDSKGRFEDQEGVLYLDELSWIYNELGIASLCQGALHNAYSLFRMGQHVNELADLGVARDPNAGLSPQDDAGGHRVWQSHLNLGVVHIERARLDRARHHLQLVMRHGAPELMAQACGYLGLMHHLSGDYDKAGDHYEEAIKGLQVVNNRRGASIFRRHRADLLRKLDNRAEATAEIKTSIATAEAGRYSDILHGARISEANLLIPEQPRQALSSLRQALQFARQVRMPHLEADALRVEGNVALHQGNVQHAWNLAVLCLGIASAHGMALRVTSALTFMGRVQRSRNYREDARRILTSAIRMAEKQGYQLQREVAERELMMLD